MPTRTKRRAITMRRQPIQDRGHERIDKILDAAEGLILENGLLGLNVRAIARRSGTNIATIYAFFPGRGSITRCIVEKYNEKLGAVVAEALRRAETHDVRGALRVIQAAIVRFYVANPITREIWPGVNADPVLRALNRADGAANAAALAIFLQTLNPAASRKAVEAAATLISVTSGPVHRNALDLAPALRRRVLAAHLESVAHLIETME